MAKFDALLGRLRQADDDSSPTPLPDGSGVGAWTACTLEAGVSGSLRVRTENYNSVVRLEGTVNRGGANVGIGKIATLPAGFEPNQALVACLAANKVTQGTEFSQSRARSNGDVEVVTDGATQDLYFNQTWDI